METKLVVYQRKPPCRVAEGRQRLRSKSLASAPNGLFNGLIWPKDG